MTIPTYKAVLNYEEDGITTISWVSDPATMVDMICFSEEDRDKYRFADDEKHMVTSVVMLADTKIYRRNGDFEYYITYEKDTLLQMCEKMLISIARPIQRKSQSRRIMVIISSKSMPVKST